MDKRSAKNDNNDLRSFFFKFWKHWLVYTISIILALSIAVLYSKFKIPIFEAGSQLIVHENESSMNPGRFIEGYELFANRNDFDNELITLQSSLHVYNTIVKMNLSVSYYEYKINGSREIYKTAPFIVIFDKEIPQAVDVKFYIDIVDKKSFRISSKAKEASIYSFIDQKVLYKKENFSFRGKFNFGEEIRGTFFNFKVFLNEEHNIDEIINNKYYFILNSIHSLTHKYQSSLIIEPVNIESTVVNINHRSSNIEKSLDFLSNLNETYINSNLNKKNHIADNTIQFIDNQLNEIQDSLLISENILQDYRASHQVIDIGEKSIRIYDQLRELEQQKAELDVNSKYYSYIQDYFSKSEDISDLVVPSSLGINDQLLNNLIQELITLNAERVSLISNNQQRNPYLKNLDIKIKNLKNTIVENIQLKPRSTF